MFSLEPRCHGHFLCKPGDEPDNDNGIPDDNDGEVRYRIACIASCIQASEQGRALYDALSSLTNIEPGYIQFGSASWFWDQWVNSYVLQVEPDAQRFMDVARLDAGEARYVEKVRNQFFKELELLVASESH